MATEVRGLRNNNPGNIRISTQIYTGEKTPSTDTAFKQFQSMAYGYRAMFVVLTTYFKKYGLNTISKIINRWAPPNENNTANYIAKVSEWSGIPKDEVLSLTDGDKWIKIVAAMSRMENGVQAVFLDVENGFKLQTEIKKK